MYWISWKYSRLGIVDCEIDSEIKLPAGKIHSTVEVEPDFVRVMKRKSGERFILHIEFQTTDDREMIKRMQEYHALVQRKVYLPIRHIVIYLGKKKPIMQTQMEPSMIFSGFELEDLNTYEAEKLMASSVPEEIIMAVLANYSGESAETVVAKVLNRLKTLPLEGRKLKKYLKQLTVLSKLRNLDEEVIKQSEKMALTVDLKESYVYKKGIEKGIKQGVEKEKSILARKLKERKMSLAEISEITGLPQAEIKKL